MGGGGELRVCHSAKEGELAEYRKRGKVKWNGGKINMAEIADIIKYEGDNTTFI